MRTSAETRIGLDELSAHLSATCESVERRAARGAFRLPVDRAFTLAGRGTVVTGTVWSGRVRVGDELAWLPV